MTQKLTAMLNVAIVSFMLVLAVAFVTYLLINAL